MTLRERAGPTLVFRVNVLGGCARGRTDLSGPNLASANVGLDLHWESPPFLPLYLCQRERSVAAAMMTADPGKWRTPTRTGAAARGSKLAECSLMPSSARQAPMRGRASRPPPSGRR